MSNEGLEWYWILPKSEWLCVSMEKLVFGIGTLTLYLLIILVIGFVTYLIWKKFFKKSNGSN